MSRAERCLLRRIAVRAGTIVLLLAVLLLLFLLRKVLGAGIEALDPVAVTAEFSRFMGLALSLAGPLAAVMVLAELKGSGILATLLAAGLTSRALLRVLAIAAAATMLLTAALEEAAWLPGERSDRVPDAWRAGDLVVWRPGGDAPAAGLVVLRDDDLDVWTAAKVEAEANGFLLGEVRSLLGTPLGVQRVDGPKRATSALLPPPLSVWLRGDAPLGPTLASINRVFVAGALVLICAYCALLATAERQWVALVAYLFLVVLIGAWTVLLGVMLWKGGWSAYAATGAFWIVVAVALVLLHRAYDRRGLRLTG